MAACALYIETWVPRLKTCVGLPTDSPAILGSKYIGSSTMAGADDEHSWTPALKILELRSMGLRTQAAVEDGHSYSEESWLMCISWSGRRANVEPWFLGAQS